MPQLTNRTKTQLSEMIKKKRNEMYKAANIYGMRSNETLKYSQDLDRLILEYQKSSSNIQNNTFSQY